MKTVSWLVPKLSLGSGGQRTILMHAFYLQQKGYIINIYLDKLDNTNKLNASDLIYKIFGYKFLFVDFGWEKITNCDISISTYWTSAKFLYSLDIITKKCYFVQDYEPLFYSGGEKYIQALRTYDYGFNIICIGRWLQTKLLKAHNTKSFFTKFCANLQIYSDKNFTNIKKKKAIAVLYQPEKLRRCSSLILNTLNLLYLWDPNLEIHIFGSNQKPHLNFKYIFHGLVSKEECANIYNSCKLGICLSATNPSRIPFEMMACGLPVVDLYSDNNLYDYSSEFSLLANPEVIDIAASVYNLINNNLALKQMSLKAKDIMKNRDEKNESIQFEKALIDIHYNKSPPNVDLTTSYNSEAFLYDKTIDPLIPEKYIELSFEVGLLSKIHPILAKMIRKVFSIFI